MRKLRNKRSHFNMVEIVLAIAILAFGFASILGLFPVAIKMVRSSQTESVVSDAAEDLNAYFRTMARVPLIDLSSTEKPKAQLDGEFWYALLFYKHGVEPSGDYVSSAQEGKIQGQYTSYYNKVMYEESDLETLRDELSSAAEKTKGEKFLTSLKDKIASYSSDNVREKLASESGFNLLPNLDLFQPDPQKTNYYLVRGDEKFNKIDLSAQIILWKSKMQKIYAKNESYDSNGLNYRYATVLNMEVSWPLSQPYPEREKRYYQFIIANPKKR
ncbi:MAG: hypothetical protein PHT71_02910 [Victivallaceae bacterium]|nr:hypothetical protein [Victivallaceae bacterium]